MPIESRDAALFEDHRREIFQRVDRLFAALLLFQWVAGLGVALWVSPVTWAGRMSEVHPHVWTTLGLGSLITFFPVALAIACPGQAFTRHTIGIAQMLWSALLIHLTGGRIETHFHVFGSLAFLAFYRDWKVIVTATVVVASDHVLRGYFWPESVYGIALNSRWRWVEHAGWVVFEDAFLIRSCIKGIQEMQDVARRQAQTEVSAERKNEILINSIDGVVWEAEAGTFQYRFVSPQVTRILGYAPEAWILEKDFWQKKLHPSDRNRILLEALDHSLKAENYELEYRILNASGNPVWVHDAVSVHRDPSGATLLRGILTDISGRKRQEQRILQSERRFRTVVEQAADVLFVHDLEGHFLDANEQACSSLGYSREELLTKSVFDVERSVPREQLLAAWKQLVPGKPITAEGYAMRKDGSTFPIEVRVGLLESEGKTLVMALVRDVTERKRLDRMKNEFISTVSHELRTPLTSIRGALGLVSSGVIGELSPKAKPLVEIAAKNCERLVNLVSDILDIEKIASGQMVFKIRPLLLGPFLQQAIEANRGFAETSGVALKLETGPVETTVLADGDRLMQVLTNLMSNACKYSPKGETVVVTLTRAGERIRVSVRDRGPGLSEEFRARIFQKFAQADTSDGSQRKGTGLGLAISKALIERMGGTIGFESTPGSGSTFFFELNEQKPVRPAAPMSSRPRILVCEDERDIAEILRQMLDREGYECDVVASLREAREFLARTRYAGLTLDLALADGNGITLLKELRQNPLTLTLPVIVVSANLDENRPSLSGHAFGLVDWLEKPIPEDRLRTALQRSCAVKGGKRARVLHVEDDPDIARVVGETLTGIADVVQADRVLGAWEKLKEEDFDLLIVDVGLPDGSGLELLPALKRSTQTPIPALVFSAHELSPRTKNYVSAALLKSKTSNEELVERVRSLLGAPSPTRAKA